MTAIPNVLSHRPSVTLVYTNYRGETAERTIVPVEVRFDATEWHPEKQYLLRGWDVDKGAYRDFALKDFGHKPVPAAEAAEAAELTRMQNLLVSVQGDLDAIAAGRGMFGVKLEEDLAWAMQLAGEVSTRIGKVEVPVDDSDPAPAVETNPPAHPYESWELFGKFICHATETGIDELDVFVRSWSEGDWSVLDKDWPEWVEFVRLKGEKV